MVDETLFQAEAQRLLSSWLERPKFKHPRGAAVADLLVEDGTHRLVIEYKRNGDASSVGAAVEQVRRYAAAVGRRAIPVVAVNFMGGAGRQICEREQMSWFDLSGNASIIAPGLRIIVDGRRNKYLQRGRPSSVFAPKSARITRHLLIEPSRFFRQLELSRETELDDGFTSRIVRRLDEQGLLERADDGAVRPRDPDLLLDAWSEVYAFDKHSIMRGHVTARSGEELLSRVVEKFDKAGEQYAATGLAAAWLATEFAAFRLVTVFLGARPSRALLDEIGFREETRGANLWLVVPDDEGVFDGALTKKGVRLVHPVQAYVDLKGHPERARDAADQLRSVALSWGRDDN